MTTLTVQAVRENPWNVVAQPLPEFPTELLLRVALRAAEYCAGSEYGLMQAARDGRYIPSSFSTDVIWPDAHEESEERHLQARAKFDEIGGLLMRMRSEEQ